MPIARFRCQVQVQHNLHFRNLLASIRDGAHWDVTWMAALTRATRRRPVVGSLGAPALRGRTRGAPPVCRAGPGWRMPRAKRRPPHACTSHSRRRRRPLRRRNVLHGVPLANAGGAVVGVPFFAPEMGPLCARRAPPPPPARRPAVARAGGHGTGGAALPRASGRAPPASRPPLAGRWPRRRASPAVDGASRRRRGRRTRPQ